VIERRLWSRPKERKLIQRKGADRMGRKVIERRLRSRQKERKLIQKNELIEREGR
jgi:hypothetical protein